MLDIIKHNEIINSVDGTAKERLTSHLYGVFIISWLAFHWELIYTAFFVSEDKIWVKYQLLRNEYLKRRFFDYHSKSIHCLEFWLLMLLPFALTYLIIWIFPKYLLLPAFKKHEEDITERKKILIDEQRKLEQAETRLQQEVVKSLEVKEEKAEKTERVRRTNPEALWLEEYKEFKTTQLYQLFNYLVEAIYQKSGQIRITDYNDNIIFEVPTDVIVFADTNSLITFDPKISRKISLTDKGKFFVKQYSLDRNKPQLQK